METQPFIRKTCKRYNVPGHTHELTFSYYRNQKFLLSDRTCQWLIESIQRAREKHHFSLWAFVFMPNHVHLLINPMDEEYNISNILKDIKTYTARKAVKYLKENKPSALSRLSTAQQYRKYRFWQKGGGYDRNIIKQNTLIESVKYIHNNPVRKALVDEPGKWYYSSYNCWMNGVDEPLRIDKETWSLFLYFNLLEYHPLRSLCSLSGCHPPAGGCHPPSGARGRNIKTEIILKAVREVGSLT